MPGAQALYNTEKTNTKRCWYTGTDTLYDGYALCYDRDSGTASDADTDRIANVEKPSAGNLHNFAGIVKGGGKTGPTAIDVVVPVANEVWSLYTTENCTLGQTWLSVVAGSYAFGGVGEGLIVGHALQTVDRSSTNGRVMAQIAMPNINELPYDVAASGGGFSPAIWESCPVNQIRNGTIEGAIFEDSFSDLTKYTWTATQATAGTWALDTTNPGVALADCNSTTVTQGINVQAASGLGFVPKASSYIWYEVRLKATDIATGPEFFAGLAEVDTTIIGTSAVSTANHLAFTSVTDDGVLLLNGEKATAGNTEAGTTLVEDTWVKLGLLVNGVTTCTGYVDGVALDDALVTANIPIVNLVPSFVCQSDGATDSIVHVEKVRVVQYAAAA